MRANIGLGLTALLVLNGVARAGSPAPGPELGSDSAGLAAVAVLAAGYFLLRYVRARRS